jgi:5-formyltetrahydrofolate cyclo-ligase
MINAKEQIRQAALDARRALTDEYRKEASATIFSRLRIFPPCGQAQGIGLYVGREDEVDTVPVIEWAAGRSKKVAVPRVEGEGLSFCSIDTIDDLAPGAFGILEPVNGRPLMAVTELDLIIVPGVAFDNRGGRIGYGKGFYDRNLVGYTGITVGLAFEAQMVEAVPQDDFDIPVDVVITESAIHDTRGEREK